MTSESNLGKQFIWTSFVVVTACLSFGFWFCYGAELDSTVQKAYELRMDGKAEQAKELLAKAISENPTNAAAHYELARTNLHMGLGNPRKLQESIGEAQQSIEKAVENEPNNVIYTFFKGHIASFQAYYSLMTGDQPDTTKENYARVCAVFESALKLKPDYYQAMLHLVEIYGILPEDKGGDKSKAEHYAKQLEEKDEIFGAKAKSILLPEEADRVEYWQNVLKEHKGNADVLVELGRAHLYKDEVEEGVSCFKQAMTIDPQRSILLLDIGRYHLYKAMRDEKLMDQELPLAQEAFNKYLSSEPTTPPLEAYTLELLAKIKWGMGDNEAVAQLRERARTIDPYHSKASGVPSPELFVPPGQISYNHRYLFRPF